MKYQQNVNSKGAVITQAEIIGIDMSKAHDIGNIYQYDIINDPSDSANVKNVNICWDTGAELTCINKTIVEEMHLPYISTRNIILADGTRRKQNTYMIWLKFGDILIVSDVVAMNLNSDILLGLDIIRMGDFCLSKSPVNILSFDISDESTQEQGNHINTIRLLT